MELQWPLIIFTTLLAWCAGLFATQALYALRGKGMRAQIPAWIVSAVLLVAGGIAVFFHLGHWERIFNGFGHLTSGITQELIAIVVLAIIAVAYLVILRKGDGSVPAWIAVLAIVASAALVVVMAHSYTMAARPAWDSLFWILYVVGNACAFGPATMAFLDATKNDCSALDSAALLVGGIVNAIATICFAASVQLSGGSFSNVGYHFDPTHPTKGLLDTAATTNLISGADAPVFWLGVIVVGAAIPLVAGLLAKKKGDAAAFKTCGAVAAIAVLVGALCMRVLFYNVGLSVFAF